MNIYIANFFGSPASLVCLLSSEALQRVEIKLLKLYLRFLSTKIENSNFSIQPWQLGGGGSSVRYLNEIDCP